MKALKSIFKDDNGKDEKEQSRIIKAKIDAGENLNADELAFVALNRAPFTQAYYAGKFAVAKMKKARA